MESKKNSSGISQTSLILRLIGGGYLIYLAYQMIPELTVSYGVRNIIQITAMAVFFLVGVLLTGWSVLKLVRGEYIRPGQEEDHKAEEGEKK